MPKRFRKSKRKSDHKKIIKLEKIIKPIVTPMVEIGQTTLGTMANSFVGLNPASSTLDALGASFTLSSLTEGLGVQSRLLDRVKFKSFQIRLALITSKNASYANFNTTLYRVTILKVKQMPGQPGNRYHPFINEVYDCTNPMSYADILSFPALQNNRDQSKNITVLCDKWLHISPTAPEAHPAKIYRNSSKPEYIGSYTQVMLNFDIKASDLITTYDNTGNVTGVCNQNHYVMYVWNPCAIAAEKPQLMVENRSQYENLL